MDDVLKSQAQRLRAEVAFSTQGKNKRVGGWLGIHLGLSFPNCAMDGDDTKLLKVFLGPSTQGFTLHQQCRPSGDER